MPQPLGTALLLRARRLQKSLRFGALSNLAIPELIEGNSFLVGRVLGLRCSRVFHERTGPL